MSLHASDASDLYTQPVIVGTTAELAEALNGATGPVGIAYIPRDRQVIVDRTIGTFKVGDGVHGYDALASLPSGTIVAPSQLNLLVQGANHFVFLTDEAGYNGTGNGLAWNAGDSDGQQRLDVQLGSTGQHTTRFQADGTTLLPGAVSVAGDVALGATFGPIVTDSTDGHTYRLGTTNGVVTATLVT
jgi:hypothetical protein